MVRLTGMILMCTALTFAVAAGCTSHQRLTGDRPGVETPAQNRARGGSGPRVDSAAHGSHVTVVDLSGKFLAFFDSASKTPLDLDAQWALWQRLYGFAARPPGPFGDTLARRLLEGAWDRYPGALARIRRGAAALEFAPDTVFRKVVDLLGCGGDTHVRLLVFVGGFEGNAFAFPGPDGTQTIAIPLEAGDALGALTHELTHAVHHSHGYANITSGYEMSLPELVISEGLAMRVSERLIPGHPSIHYVGGSQGWLDTANARRVAILNGIRQHTSDSGAATAQRFTFGTGTTGLGREAYYAGWLVTGALLDGGLSIHDIATTPSRNSRHSSPRGIEWDERGRAP